MNRNGSYHAPAIAPTTKNPRNSLVDLPLPADQRTGPEQPLSIPSEASDTIRVGSGGKLVVPREDMDTGLHDGSEIDLLSLQVKKIRKPGPLEWVVFNPASELTARLLPHKTSPDSMDTEYYFVNNALRGPIRDAIKDVRVFVYYSLVTKTFGLWILKITQGNSWYESAAQLFKRSAEFFKKNNIRIISDIAKKRYRAKQLPFDGDIAWPTVTTNELLGDALGADHFINSADHPIYSDLVAGSEIDL